MLYSFISERLSATDWLHNVQGSVSGERQEARSHFLGCIIIFILYFTLHVSSLIFYYDSSKNYGKSFENITHLFDYNAVLEWYYISSDADIVSSSPSLSLFLMA